MRLKFYENNFIRVYIMVTVIVWEYSTSQKQVRLLPIDHAHNLGLKGGFYKVQILGEFDQVDFEYK